MFDTVSGWFLWFYGYALLILALHAHEGRIVLVGAFVLVNLFAGVLTYVAQTQNWEPERKYQSMKRYMFIFSAVLLLHAVLVHVLMKHTFALFVVLGYVELVLGMGIWWYIRHVRRQKYQTTSG